MEIDYNAPKLSINENYNTPRLLYMYSIGVFPLRFSSHCAQIRICTIRISHLNDQKSFTNSIYFVSKLSILLYINIYEMTRTVASV